MKKMMKAMLAVMIAFTAFASTGGAALAANSVPAAKNVIILIPDGMGVDGTTLARWYKGGTPLAMDEMASGMVKTHSADAAIADSAPAGTAFATGHKSHTGYVGVLPDVADMPGVDPIPAGEERRPVANVLEAAKLAGKSTGIISTSEVMHATPAAFSAHYPDRSNYDALSKQQVYNGLDVVLGGGSRFFVPDGRKDGNDLLEVIKQSGYDYVTTIDELKASTADKLWGLFAPSALAYDMDRDPAKEPSLAEMTSKAIEVLSRNEEGFFLMVEGSKVDWAAHANDPIGIISDVLAFDEAVKVALDFAKKDQNTMVLAATDHGNGGITIGNAETSRTYDKLPLSTFIAPLQKAKLTGEGLEKMLNEDRSNVKEVMEQYYGISDLTDEEVKAIQETKPGSMNYTVGPMISKRAMIGWTTGGHTGGDVTLYSYTPGNGRLTGVLDNTELAVYMAEALGVDLNATTERLFVPAREAFTAKGAEVEWDITDPKNPVVIVTKGSDTLRLPIYTNIAEFNGTMIPLEGVTVFNGEKTFVPQQAIDLIP
ncbi:alkaline phosphatase [Paenibacillus senegalensis]|uniref:alkaline phosphatase n=1 Tax=Paenibacillus senegalensis TaxID=1465766 RepID=UPI00028960DC|nr:alkaline phosphatase [Paenibacillus senegalensis]